MLSDLRFGAFLAYSPRGNSAASKESRALCYAVKQDGVLGSPPEPAVEALVGRLAAALPAREDLRNLLAQDAVLVPCPTSRPQTPDQRIGSAPMRICKALVRAGVGAGVLDCLERVEAVAKSGLAAIGERVAVQSHLDSMSLPAVDAMPERITWSTTW